MVTKSTGRPTAAIDIRTASRRRGRPLKPLHTNPDRYPYAEIQALISYHQQANDGISDRQVAETVVSSYYGTLIPTDENIKAFAEGRPYQVYAQPWAGSSKHCGDVRADATLWRNKNLFRPAVDDALRNLRALRAELNQWLAIMDALVNICMQGAYNDPAMLEGAWKIADSIGERRVFEAKLAPLMVRQAAARRVAESAQLEPGFLADSFRANRLEKPGRK